MTPTANGKHASDPFGPPHRMIVLGYYDGPTSGVIQFAGVSGPTFRFEMPDEDVQLSRGFGAPREYAFSPLLGDAPDRIAAALLPHQTPTWPVWGVNWRFPTPDAEREAEVAIAAILSQAGPVQWVVSLPWNWNLEQFRPVTVRTPQPA